MGYVWQKNQIDTLGRQIHDRGVKLQELRRVNKLKADHLAALQTPPAIDARIKKLNLALVPPPQSQIVRVIEIPMKSAVAETVGAVPSARLPLMNSVAGF